MLQSDGKAMGLTLYQSGMNIFIPRLKPGKESTLHWFIDISRSSYVHCCHAHTCAFVYNNNGLINYEKKVGAFIIGRTFSQFRSHTRHTMSKISFYLFNSTGNQKLQIPNYVGTHRSDKYSFEIFTFFNSYIDCRGEDSRDSAKLGLSGPIRALRAKTCPVVLVPVLALLGMTWNVGK